MTSIRRPERAPWGSFPDVIRNDDLGSMEKEPEYRAAKSGCWESASALVERLVVNDTVNRIKELVGDRRPRIVPVLAEESDGRNKIPLSAAHVFADRLGLKVESSIVQDTRVSRTNAGADHRLAFSPTFTGPVVEGQDYLVIDDTLTMGGTLASLRGFIENRGGNVLGATVMTAHPMALSLAVKTKMLAAIEAKHGAAMNDYWKTTFGYSIDKLTQGEAGHLKKAPSVDAIRDRIIAARNEAGWREDSTVAGGKEETLTEHLLRQDVSSNHEGQSPIRLSSRM